MYMAMVFLMATAAVQATLQPIDLGEAGEFALLTKAGISTTGTTSVKGNIGTSPITSTAITGFNLAMDSTNMFSTSSLVTGQVLAASYTSPTPSRMTTAISNMETAYTDAAGRVAHTDAAGDAHPVVAELGSGNIGGMTLQGGMYKWSTGVEVLGSLTFDADGDAGTVWILQIAEKLVLGPGAQVTLARGAKASNIFWQVAEEALILAGAHAEGTILCKTAITFLAGSSLTGRGLAQTAVTMIATTIVDPQA